MRTGEKGGAAVSGWHRIWPIVGPVIVLVVWQVTHYFTLLNQTLLPSPYATISRLTELVLTGNVLPDIGVTLARMTIGYALATLVGICLGLLMGTIPAFAQSLGFLMEFGRSTPVTTCYPIFVLLFGLGHSSKIAMVFAASVFVIALNTSYGVIHSTPVRKQMAALFGASRIQIFRWVVFPGSLPQTMIGLRVALSYSLIVVVVCEMFLGSRYGIGQRVFEAYNTYNIAELYALVLIVGSIGYFLNKAFLLIEAHVAGWARA